MPSLYGAGIRVCLGAMPLSDVVTPNIVRRKGDAAARQSQEVEKKLKRSPLLSEERVQFPGDEENFGMNWLGDAPFFQVHAGGDAWKDENAPMEAKALVLHVMLSDKSFFESFTDGKPQHLMIDVFLNGQLSCCVLIHQSDIRAGAKSMHQIFAGTRVDFLVERPWVILPPGASVGDEMTRDAYKPSDARERWQQICAALAKQANAKGVDKDGRRPPSGHFLHELAIMTMPEQVKNMQQPGGMSFGVIDVVVTVGMGRKLTSGTSYCTKPMILPDERYSYEVVEVLPEEKSNRTERRQDQELVVAEKQKEQTVAQAHDEEVVTEEGAAELEDRDALSLDQDADGESDLEYLPDPRPKPAEERTIGAPSVEIPGALLLPPVFQNPFTGERIPSLPPPPGPILASRFGPQNDQGALVQQRQRGVTSFRAPSKEHGNIHNHAASASRRSYPSAHAPSAAMPGFPFARPATVHFDLNQYGGFMSNPYELPYAGMMIGLDPFSNTRFPMLDGPASSPPNREFHSQHTLPSFQPPTLGETQTARSTTFPFATGTFTGSKVSNQPRRVSFGPASIASYRPEAPPMSTPPGSAMSAQGHFSLPATPMGSSPPFYPYYGPMVPPHLPGAPFMYPNKPTSAAPPPPVGYFAATTKPKAALYRNSVLIDPDAPRSSMLLRWLTISGKEGATLVDHRWATPQRISLKRKRNIALPKARRVSPGSEEYLEPSTKTCKRGSGNGQRTPPPVSPSKPELDKRIDVQEKRDSLHDRALTDYTPEPPSREPVVIPQSLARDGEQSQGSLGMTSRTTKRSSSVLLPTQPGVGRRRTTSCGILGVQGPKASTFVFDNPEELLRKGSKSKSNSRSRSISPTKANTAKATSTAAPAKEVKEEPVGAGFASGRLDSGSSSPLSSVPDSPYMAADEPRSTGEGIKILSLVPRAECVPSQLGKLASPSPSAQLVPFSSATVSSPPALPAPVAPTSALLPPASTEATPTKQSPLRKRVSQQIPPARRRPRNSDLLRTTENPPLNQNCVIAYAVSKDEKCVLRQVKGERQGVFKEESVVMGVRFFVAG